MDAHLSKPVSSQELVEALAHHRPPTLYNNMARFQGGLEPGHIVIDEAC